MHCPEVQISGMASNLTEGVEKIKELKPDVVFLDIEMPNYAGYEITSLIDNIDFEIIFVTAYDGFAIKAFELAAVDYLLKPIEISRLKEAVSKFVQQVQNKKASLNYEVLIESLKENTVKKIVVQTSGGQRVVDVEEIVAIEANESYSMLHMLGGKKVMYSKNLKHFETLLKENQTFIRTHKSWLINTKHMVKYSKSNFTIEMNDGIVARLSKYKMEQFENSILA